MRVGSSENVPTFGLCFPLASDSRPRETGQGFKTEHEFRLGYWIVYACSTLGVFRLVFSGKTMVSG